MSNINSKQPEEKQNFHSSIKKGIGALILFIIIAIAGVIGRYTVKYFTKKYLPSGNGDTNISEMSRHIIGSSGLSILSPGVLKERSLPVPDNFRDKIVSFQNYEYREGYQIAIKCSEMKYVPEIVASSEGAANNILKSLSNLNGVSEFRHNQKPISQSGLDGVSFSEEYKENNAPIIAKGIVLTN